MSEQDKQNEEWNAMAGEWDDLADGYSQGFFGVLQKDPLIPLTKESIVVDFGCGTGLLTDRLRTQVQQVIAVDAAPKMVEQLKEKIRTREGWENVDGRHVILGSDTVESNQLIQDYEGKVDVIVASSVLAFVPRESTPSTLAALGRLLKPNGGLLCHSDWPKNDQQPSENPMTEERAKSYYEMAGLQPVTTKVMSMSMGDSEAPIFFGLAKKE